MALADSFKSIIGGRAGPSLARALAKRSFSLQVLPARRGRLSTAIPACPAGGRARVRTSLLACRGSTIIILFFTLLLINEVSYSQLALTPRPSPLAIATARYKDTYLKIVYSQPHKRGREIFGKTVPYNQVWRTGANETTEITITKDILMNNQPLKAGTYSLLTIPNKDDWTIIIINSDVGMWGSYNYNVKQDVLRFDASVETLTDVVYEPFTILIDQKTDKATLSLLWDKTKVTFPIQFIESK